MLQMREEADRQKIQDVPGVQTLCQTMEEREYRAQALEGERLMLALRR